jgi:diguanylate cyclase (GGDEF)-like protein/PAS domain S-box-containing protein
MRGSRRETIFEKNRKCLPLPPSQAKGCTILTKHRADNRRGPKASADRTAGRTQVANDPQFLATLHRTAMESSPDGILVVDAEARIISFNRRFVELWNLPHDIVAAGNDAPVLATVTGRLKDPKKFLARVRYLYDHPDEKGHDELELADGRIIDRHTAALRDSDRRYLGRIWFFRDISERKRAEQQIRTLARQDVLTGLANRAVFVGAIQHAIAWAEREQAGFAVLYLDLDHFKDVNDTLGHPVGDLLLQSVAQRLRANVRGIDTVARFGGDEFAVLAAGMKDSIDAGMLAEKLLAVVAEPHSIKGNEIRIGTSIGIAVYGPDNRDPETILSHADLALYRAKSEGRRTYRFFTDAMDVEVHSRVSLGSELRKALEGAELFLEYQPQVRLDDCRVVGMEALVRWRHPERGLLSPGGFIPAAERSGIIIALGEWTLRAACRQAKEWLDAGLDLPFIGVNVSAIQFKSAGALEAGIRQILAETGLAPGRLEIELTETALMEASREHGAVLRRLQESGVRLALDDFGTGYSSLGYLRRFPVNRIKIAQGFVGDLATDPGSAAIVRAAIGLARELGIKVIAEGVETGEQAARLAEWGCAEAQGFHFAAPMAADAAANLLRAGRIVR